jgi:16S rRNA (uracil1498-N3)-methyltransferase
LFLAIVKFDAFEWALEKATELGVNRIVPLACARSERGLLAAAGKRAERWKKIVFESSQQSRRVRLPVIDPVARVDAAFSETESKLKIMFSERETAQSLKHILAETNSCTVAMAIGPEGGWTEQEFAAGKHAGFVEASLGSLILRTETAVTAGLAALNYALDAESE